MIIIDEVKLDYKDVLLRPKRSTLNSRKEVSLEREFHFPHSPKIRKWVPIIAANMDTIATKELAQEFYKHGMITCLHKFYSEEEIIWMSNEVRFANCAISIGILDNDLEKLSHIMKAIQQRDWTIDKVHWICIDVANGYTERFTKTIKQIRSLYPEQIIIAGNVVTREMTEELILAWADIVKVGIWPGSACTTRIQSGIGYPQLSSVIECADAAHGLDGHIIADGWIVVPGDFSKAYGAWADFTMCWGIFAGHDETAGDIIKEEWKQYKLYYGMSSDTAMEKHYGGVAEYRSSEWKTVKVPYKWALSNTIQSILGGIRSACTYIGARSIKHMPKCTTFIRVSQQSNEVWGKNS